VLHAAPPTTGVTIVQSSKAGVTVASTRCDRGSHTPPVPLPPRKPSHQQGHMWRARAAVARPASCRVDGHASQPYPAHTPTPQRTTTTVAAIEYHASCPTSPQSYNTTPHRPHQLRQHRDTCTPLTLHVGRRPSLHGCDAHLRFPW